MALQTLGSRKRKAPTEQVVPGMEATTNSPPLLGRRASADGGPGVAAQLEENPDYPIPNFEEVYARMRNSETGFIVSDRRWRLMSYPKCFVGSEAVDWMMNSLSLDRPAAIRTGQHLMDAGIIHHVTHSEPFADTYYFYRFQEDDESCILNMKRVWDTALPTRNAVQVSQNLLTQLACLCEEYRLRIIAAPPTPQLGGIPYASEPQSMRPTANDLPTPSSLPAVSLPIGAVGPSLAGSTSQSPVVQDPALVARTQPEVSVGSCERTRPQATAGISPTILCGAADDVDYSLLAKSEEFRQYTLSAAELQGVQLQALTHDEKIAFFGNVYNALCLHCYIVQSAPTNIIRRWVFFRTLAYRIAGLDMSLDDIEHGILRGNKRAPMIKIVQQLRPSDPKCQYVLSKRDGRIHFVISAGTRSDPPIRILDSESVQEQLHEGTVEFLSRSVKIDVAARTVTLPRIFMWYADDFPNPELALLRWVGRHLLAEPAGALLSLLVNGDENPPTVAYENFEWCVSDTRFNAAVVRRKRRRLERERAAVASSFQATTPSNIGAPNMPSPNLMQLGPNSAVAMQAAALKELATPPIDFGQLLSKEGHRVPESSSQVHGQGGDSLANGAEGAAVYREDAGAARSFPPHVGPGKP